MTNFEWRLTPSRHDEKSKALVLQLSEWSAALRLSRQMGFAAPEFAGMTRDAARCFMDALRAAVQAGRVDEGDRAWVGRLIDFLEREAKGGFTMDKQWKSWKRALTK